MINFLLDKKIYGIFIFIYLISSINSPFFIPNNIELITIFNFLRSLAPLFIVPFLLVLFFLNRFKLSKSSLVFIILILSQIIGFFLNEQRKFYDLYWLICAISLVLFLEYYCNKISDLKKIVLVFISLIFIITISISHFTVLEIVDNYSSYEKIFNSIYTSDVTAITNSYLNQPVPRSSGYARFLLIIFLFLLPFIFFTTNKKKNLKFKIINILIILLLIFIPIILWKIQNRSSLYFYLILSLVFFYLIVKKIKIIEIFYFSIIFILPYFVIQAEIAWKKKIVTNYIKIEIPNSKEADEFFNQNYSRDLDRSSRWARVSDSSGRVEIWNNSFKIIKQNFLFGLGPQTDRNTLNHNASNILIYFFLCGGLFSIIIFLIYATNLIFVFFHFLKSRNITKIKNDKLLFFSILIFSFLNFRGLTENSYSLYGIDMVGFLLSTKYLELSYKVNK
jgi:hypothetical protein